MKDLQNATDWSENVIVVDADYADKVAFDFIVNFERMLGRRVPQADLGHWLDCIALDGGMRPGNNETSVVLIHGAHVTGLENFKPGSYRDELHMKAFKDSLGEFALSAWPAVEGLVERNSFVLDVVRSACAHPQVKRIMIVADTEHHYDDLRRTLRNTDEKHVTVFTHQPMQGGNFRQEMLGYSLVSALGISPEEFNNR